ncbi:hypothetical protein GVN16_16020 [Emticicia sp. CRIBPO]|uniref:hypothetical protein n=1 Tax=Emticicia sp. CRIBPO TaxID=2683258 RepID=UPI00141356A1|nr:hypothetical protein [Emticicia sp. CRIBPO]NBA87281.1 hypothetical protein [Emticicia sp. CRIBPO]
MKFALFAIFISLLLAYYTQSYIVTENEIYNFYSTQLSYEQIESLLNQQNKWVWLGYVFIPVIYLLKISIISLTLLSGLFFSQISKPRFSEVFSIVAKADLILLTPAVLKIGWFTFQTNYTLEDVQYFMPGSLLNFFEPTLVEKWLLYPLQALNVFELGFWLWVAYELKPSFKEDFTRSFQTVALSYGSCFMIWIVFVAFLTLNLS